jgi:hypothetical protein
LQETGAAAAENNHTGAREGSAEMSPLLTLARSPLPANVPSPSLQRGPVSAPQRNASFAGYDVTSIRTHAPYLARQKKAAAPKKLTLQEALTKTLTRKEFEEFVQEQFGIEVRNGTFAEQSMGVPDLAPAQFKPWGPVDGTTDLNEFIRALSEYDQNIGISKSVKKLLFFEKAWVEDSTNKRAVETRTLAQFGFDTISFFSRGTSDTPKYAAGRSEPGKDADASRDGPQKAPHSNLVHELGHATESDRGGLDEAREFESEVGWWRNPDGSNARLYDIGRRDVREARLKNTPPPEDARITSTNWNNGAWKEQPVSDYAATDPGEDYAESVKVFLTKPDVLKKRSPRRFDFISKLKKKKPAKGKKP